MRQSGIPAAGALYAVENNISRLSVDHNNAKILAEGLNKIDNLAVDMKRVQTNIVIVEIGKTGLGSADVVGKFAEKGVLCVPFGRTRVRFVTHLDVNEDDCLKAVELVSQVKL